jgi:hypothetical protein
MGQRRSGGHRSGPHHLSPSRRLPFLLGTAALAAVGFSVIAPSASADDVAAPDDNRQAELILTAESQAASAATSADDGSTDTSPQAASALAQAQARVQALAAAAAASSAAAPPPAPAFPATPDGYRAYARTQVDATQFRCLDALWTRESGWRATAQNPSSTAYGIAQLLNSTWRYTGIAKTSDGFRQVDAGLAYLDAAYPGGPCSAWAHEKTDGWY